MKNSLENSAYNQLRPLPIGRDRSLILSVLLQAMLLDLFHETDTEAVVADAKLLTNSFYLPMQATVNGYWNPNNSVVSIRMKHTSVEE